MTLCCLPCRFSFANQPPSALDLTGAPFDPFKAAPGKAVVLVFVRTDCPVTNRYIPQLEQIRSRFPGKSSFWLVYPDKAESAEQIRKHDKEYRLTIPSLRDPQHILVKLSGAQITPEVAVFNAKRGLVYHGRIDNLYEDFGHKRSSATTHELLDALQAAISGSSIPEKATPAIGCYISDLE
jgi:AhpC/TSA family